MDYTIYINKLTFNLIDFFFSLPEFFLIFASFILLLFNINYNSSKIIKDRIILLLPNYYLTIQMLIITLLLLLNIKFFESNHYIIFNNLFNINFYIIFFKILIICSSILVLLISFQYIIEYKNIFIIFREKFEYSLISYEYLIILIFAIIGMLLLTSSYDMISLYLSIELQSISLYILATFRKNILSIEAGLKYFLLGSLASIFMIFGFSFLYGLTGATNFSQICIIERIDDLFINANFLLLISIIFIIIGLFMKLGVAPFHSWLPDVYEGTSTNTTAFFAVITKLSLICVLIKLFFLIFSPFIQLLCYLFSILSILSMLIGAIGALFQISFKRLFAYSSINTIGLILMSLVSGDVMAIMAILVHLINYIIVSIGLFIILLSCIIDYSNFKDHFKGDVLIKEFDTLYINDVSGLFYSNPFLAIIISILLLSSAGIPPLAGFFGKYYLFLTIIENNYYFLAGVGILTSVVTTTYYIRIIIKMFVESPSNINIFKNINFISSYLLILVTLLIIIFIIYPYPILLLSKFAAISII